MSGKSTLALQQLAGRYSGWLAEHPDAVLADVCHTAGAGRSHLEQRAAMVIESHEQAQLLLGALQRGEPTPGLHVGEATAPPKVAWLFTGQGSHYARMAHDLYESEPAFDRQSTSAAG